MNKCNHVINNEVHTYGSTSFPYRVTTINYLKYYEYDSYLKFKSRIDKGTMFPFCPICGKKINYKWLKEKFAKSLKNV